MKHVFFFSVVVTLFACQNSTANITPNSTNDEVTNLKTNAVAYFASGCFWCVEAVFESVKGVGEVESGYASGEEKNPTYEQVSAGTTGHAEAVRVYYDSNVVSYTTLLTVFFDSHDPSTLNQQGPDRGTQYRSVIFYQNEREKTMAQNYISDALLKKQFTKITTEVVPFDIFYKAEAYHQNYERLHPDVAYVRAVSIPRINRFKALHPELLK